MQREIMAQLTSNTDLTSMTNLPTPPVDSSGRGGGVRQDRHVYLSIPGTPALGM